MTKWDLPLWIKWTAYLQISLCSLSSWEQGWHIHLHILSHTINKCISFSLWIAQPPKPTLPLNCLFLLCQLYLALCIHLFPAMSTMLRDKEHPDSLHQIFVGLMTVNYRNVLNILVSTPKEQTLLTWVLQVFLYLLTEERKHPISLPPNMINCFTIIFFSFCPTAHSMEDLTSSTSDWACAPCTGSTES